MTDFLTHIRQKIVPRDYYARHREVLHRKKIVFTNGCFDILHTGHVTCLAKARQMGDLLVVGLNSDDSVRRLKGAERPVNDEHSRALLLAALEAVDYVTIFEEDTPYNLICQVKPDILVKGGDYVLDNIVGADFVRQHGGQVCTIPLVEGFSTTSIIDHLKQE
ncbi:MAG: D-glycero-beta-D-manno-heptose 1-phosphate adenylyltransferase [Bacteroidales bacterium]|nr:D-glycero-beta-D-manno-heptose 1-phosphate adenylyltransferase [Bacteroidales bacterium]